MKASAIKDTLRPTDYLIIILTLGSTITYSIIQHRIDILGTVALLFGVTGTVLSAKRSIWNFVFSTVNVTLYAIIAYNATNYGQAALNALYYLPMQFIGWRAWSRRKDEHNTSKVRSRSLTRRQMICCVAALIAGVAVTWTAMRYLTDAEHPFKDSLTTVLFVIGQILLTMAVWQQWIFWIAGNLVNIVLWSMVMASGDMVGGLMVIKYSMYMINCINGIVIWRRTAMPADSRRTLRTEKQ